MFDLFRFMLLRASIPLDIGMIIPTDEQTAFQRQLEGDRKNASPAAKMTKTADAFIAGGDFVSDPERLVFATGYDRLWQTLKAKVPADRKALAAAIEAAFGMPVSDLAAETGFARDRELMADSLIAAKLGSAAPEAPLDLLARNIRLHSLVRRAAEDDERLDQAGAIEAALDAHLVLPAGLLPLPEPAAGKTEERPEQSEEGERTRQQAEREFRALTEAHRFLGGLDGQDIVDNIDQVHVAAGPAQAAESLDEALLREVHELRMAVGAREGARAPLGMLAGTSERLRGARLMLRREALERAPEPVHEALRDVGVDLSRVPIPDALDRINARLTELVPVVAAADEGAISLVGGLAIPTGSVPDLNPAGAARRG